MNNILIMTIKNCGIRNSMDGSKDDIFLDKNSEDNILDLKIGFNDVMTNYFARYSESNMAHFPFHHNKL